MSDLTRPMTPHQAQKADLRQLYRRARVQEPASIPAENVDEIVRAIRAFDSAVGVLGVSYEDVGTTREEWLVYCDQISSLPRD
jgi:hypothetical protein